MEAKTISEKPLAGRRILVPESRELDLFARMLEERGAEAVRCPLVTIRDVEDPAPVEAWVQRLVAGTFDDLILLTGEGLRRLLAVAQRAGIEAKAVAAGTRQMGQVSSHRLEQGVGPHDIGVDEFRGAGDRTINVTFGGEVDHCVGREIGD